MLSKKYSKNRKNAIRLGKTLLIYAILLFFLLPIFWLISTSLKTEDLIFKLPPKWIFKPTISNYTSVLNSEFIFAYLNSIIITASSTLIALVLGVPAGYGLARISSTSSLKWMGLGVLIGRMVPPVVFSIPFYLLFWKIGLLGSHLALVIVYQTFILPFVTWLMSGFFKGIPVSIEEAARIDGCSRIGVLLRVTIPLSLPGIASAAIFSAIWAWNAYLFPLVLANMNSRPATVYVAKFLSFESLNWGELAAAGVLVALPICIFGLFVQRGFVRGLTMGATKE